MTINIWTLVNKANELGSMELALDALKPTRRECDIIDGQRNTVMMRVREAIESCPSGKKLAQGAKLAHPDLGMVDVSLDSDDGFFYFLTGVPSYGEEVCRQIVADPDSMLPENNWLLFEQLPGSLRWVPKMDEDYWNPLEDYYLRNYILPINPNYEDAVFSAGYELPLDGFISRPPDSPPKNRHAAVEQYEKYVLAMSTEKASQEYYKVHDQLMMQAL